MHRICQVTISSQLGEIYDGEVARDEALLDFPAPPPLIAIARVLYSIEVESPRYCVTDVSAFAIAAFPTADPLEYMQENCWFFTSVIQEALIKNFGAEYRRGGLNHIRYATKRRVPILARISNFGKHSVQYYS